MNWSYWVKLKSAICMWQRRVSSNTRTCNGWQQWIGFFWNFQVRNDCNDMVSNEDDCLNLYMMWYNFYSINCLVCKMQIQDGRLLDSNSLILQSWWFESARCKECSVWLFRVEKPWITGFCSNVQKVYCLLTFQVYQLILLSPSNFQIRQNQKAGWDSRSIS